MRDCNIVFLIGYVNTSYNLHMESNPNIYQAYQMTTGVKNRFDYD